MKKILIWGTGTISKRILKNGLNGNIIGFIETRKNSEMFYKRKVYDIEEIPKIYDYILVANIYVNEIYDEIQKRNLDISKIIFLKNIKKQMGYDNLEDIRNILGEKNYIDYCIEYGLNKNTFFDNDIQEYNKLNIRENFKIKPQYIQPIITDKYAPAGTMGNYFLQDLWAAKLVLKSGVKNHFDIGSRLDGFIAHLLASGVSVTMIDIREFPGMIEGLHTIVDDATTLHQIENNSIESISALCSIEHFGLGRYGDVVNPEACFECFDNIQKKLKSNGRLYLSLPIGKEHLEFNAHRIFYASTILNCFKQLNLVEFSCASNGKIEYNIDIHKYDYEQRKGDFRYGLFSFIK